MIFHIAKTEDWLNANKQGMYRTSTLEMEGFIHCSTINQVIRVADFLFKGQNNLILLEINEELINSDIKYEGETEEMFPHIYGPINLNAVINTHEFKPQTNGLFCIPDTVST